MGAQSSHAQFSIPDKRHIRHHTYELIVPHIRRLCATTTVARCTKMRAAAVDRGDPMALYATQQRPRPRAALHGSRSPGVQNVPNPEEPSPLPWVGREHRGHKKRGQFQRRPSHALDTRRRHGVLNAAPQMTLHCIQWASAGCSGRAPACKTLSWRIIVSTRRRACGCGSCYLVLVSHQSREQPSLSREPPRRTLAASRPLPASQNVQTTIRDVCWSFTALRCSPRHPSYTNSGSSRTTGPSRARV
jgi:hypothetical protein